MSKVVILLTTTSGSATGGSFTPDKHASPGTTRTGPLKFQASIAGTGAVSSTVIVEFTNTPGVSASWGTGVTFTLSGTTTDMAQYVTLADWANIRAKTTAISGTDATVTVTMGV